MLHKQFSLYDELRIKIKTLSCNRSATPTIKIVMPFDHRSVLFNAGWFKSSSSSIKADRWNPILQNNQLPGLKSSVGRQLAFSRDQRQWRLLWVCCKGNG